MVRPDHAPHLPISKKTADKFSEPIQLTFAQNDTQTYRQVLEQGFDKSSRNLVNVLSAIVDNIIKTKSKTQEYFTTGKAEAGLDAFAALYSTETNLETLSASISGGGSENIKTKAKQSS